MTPRALSLLLRNLLFTFVIPATVAVYVPLWLAPEGPLGPIHRGDAWRWLALLPLGLGLGIYTWCVWDFASFGSGTPAPIDAPKRLVIRGLYRVVRNPMYLGVLSVILGWAIWFGSARLVLYAGLVAVLFHLFVIGIEEPTLRRSFGPDYERYKATVNRWLPGKPKRGGRV